MRLRTGRAGKLFSAYAEVFPTGCVAYGINHTFLCLRRGVSWPGDGAKQKKVFSLPTQRCFQDTRGNPLRTFLFSAYAEVFPRRDSKIVLKVTFLCLRRGVSAIGGVVRPMVNFSLPTQRCFPVRPEPGPPPSAFLCLRRGVSHQQPGQLVAITFSLPTQRCFFQDGIMNV